jgi:hypothetical protein
MLITITTVLLHLLRVVVLLSVAHLKQTTIGKAEQSVAWWVIPLSDQSISANVSGTVSGGRQYLEALIDMIGWHCDVRFLKSCSEIISGFVSEKY